MDVIYTLSGGGWYRDSLNAIVSFMGSGEWTSLVSMATVLSVVVTSLAYLRGHDIMVMLRWAATFALVSGVLITVTRPVQIIDLSRPDAVYQVDNVPVGLVLPASLITSVGHALVAGYERVFHQPDALLYGKTGMLFGAGLVGRSTDFISASPQVNALFPDFVQNCVIGDMLLNHKYSLHDLMNTTDPFSLILSRPSPLRGLFVSPEHFYQQYSQHQENTPMRDAQGIFITCAQAAATLRQALALDTTTGGKTWSWYVRQLFGGRPDASALFGEMLGNSYAWFYGGARTASEIMKQNVTLNALRKGIQSHAARSGDTASLLNLSSESSWAKLRISQATAAEIAARNLPVLQTVLMGTLLGLFPVVMLLALISVLSMEVIKGYVFTLAWLQSWPLLFAILNNAMNFYLRVQVGSTPLTLSNLSLTQQHYSDISSTAGWLTISIPPLSFYIVKGMGNAMLQAGSYLGSAMQSASSQASSQTVDGTWAFNNMQMDNVQGFKWDTNSSTASGQMTAQQDNGALATQTSSGGMVYNTALAMSKLPLDINFGHMLGSTAQQLARESENHASSAMEGFNQSSSSAWNQATQLSHQSGISDSVTRGADSSQAMTATQGVHQMVSAAKSHATRHNISEAQAWNELMDKSRRAEISGGTSGTIPLPFKKQGTVGMSIRAGTGASDSTSVSASSGTDHSASESDQNVRDFREGMDTVRNWRASESASHTDNSSRSQLEQLGATLGKADSQYQQYTDSQTRSQEYARMASLSETHSAQIQGSYAQEFVEYVQAKSPDQAQTLLTDTASPDIRAQREQLAGQFMEETLRARVDGHFNASRGNLSDGMKTVSLPSGTSADGAWQQGQKAIQSQTAQSGIPADITERTKNMTADVKQRVFHADAQMNTEQGVLHHERDRLDAAHHQVAEKFHRDYKEARVNQYTPLPKIAVNTLKEFFSDEENEGDKNESKPSDDQR